MKDIRLNVLKYINYYLEIDGKDRDINIIVPPNTPNMVVVRPKKFVDDLILFFEEWKIKSTIGHSHLSSVSICCHIEHMIRRDQGYPDVSDNYVHLIKLGLCIETLMPDE